MMCKTAITVQEQIELLEKRGMIISDPVKAKEVLLDVGYYRLGFYWFPFEQTYPHKYGRHHLFRPGTNFDNIVKLYYFDFNLRDLLIKYLNRIEINFRTMLTYHISIEHRISPTWFADPNVVSPDYTKRFGTEIYSSKRRQNAVLQYHHKVHINDVYAPAWKTIEFMTLGEIINLYKAIKSIDSRSRLAKLFGINNTKTFESYLSVVRTVRNRCAHGNVLYDITLPTSIRKGPANIQQSKDYQRLAGALRVIYYMIGCVSVNRQADFKDELTKLFSKAKGSPEVCDTVRIATGIEDIETFLV